VEARYPKAYEYVNIKPARIVTVVDEGLTQQLRERIRFLEEQQKTPRNKALNAFAERLENDPQFYEKFKKMLDNL
jgi:hypothetical protein